MIGVRGRTPVILQSEAAECALACLCMIAAHHGCELDLRSARARFSLSLRGCTVSDLIGMGAALGLQARAVRLELHELKDLGCPAILHWQMNHFVVLVKVTHDRIVIHDPASGKRLVARTEADAAFTGVALEFARAPDFAPGHRASRLTFGTLWSGIEGLPRLAAELFLLSMVLQLISLATPWLFQRVIDDVLMSDDRHLLLAVTAGLAFLLLFESGVRALRTWGIDVAGAHLSRRLASAVMQHLLKLPLPFFERRHTGDILMRLDSMHALRVALTTTVVGILVDGVVVLFTCAVMFLYDGMLAGVACTALVLLLLLRLARYPRQRRLQDALLHRQAREHSHTIETLRVLTSIRSANGESTRLQRWSALFTGLVGAGLDLSRFNTQIALVEDLVQALAQVAIVYVAASLVIGNPQDFTIGMLFAFMAYKAQFSERGASLLDHLLECRLLELHLQRVGDILLEPAVFQDGLLGTQVTFEGDIRLDRVGYRYAPGEPWVLRNLTATFPAGRMIAIVGVSGAGKTTLMKLLLGLYDATEGSLRVGSVPIRVENAPLWRRQVGVVLQEDQLVGGTIADNIAFLSPDMDLLRVEQAAMLAGLHDEVRAMPMAYLSLVGDLGSTLSSGQKQRLLIARALYRRPEVLLLDEGSAHLDPGSERHLCEVLAALPISRIVVAHRPALIGCADVVFELRDGVMRDVTATYRAAAPA